MFVFFSVSAYFTLFFSMIPFCAFKNCLIYPLFLPKVFISAKKLIYMLVINIILTNNLSFPIVRNCIKYHKLWNDLHQERSCDSSNNFELSNSNDTNVLL
jgi:hypothetical protein